MTNYKQTEKGESLQVIFDTLVKHGLAEIGEEKAESPTPVFTDGRARKVEDVKFSVDSGGRVFELGPSWTGYDKGQLIAAGNAYITEAAARKELLTRKSRVASCPVPKVGDRYYCVGIFVSSKIGVDTFTWKGDEVDEFIYSCGHVFALSPEGKKLAEEWIERFGSL